MKDDEHWRGVIERFRVVFWRDPEALTAMEALVERLRGPGSDDIGLPWVSVGWLNYRVPERDGCVFVSFAGDGNYKVTIMRGPSLDTVYSRVTNLASVKVEIAHALTEAKLMLPAQ